MRTNPLSTAIMLLACEPNEADRREPIMMVSTDSIEVRDMRCHFNVPPLGLCEALSDGLHGGGKTSKRCIKQRRPSPLQRGTARRLWSWRMLATGQSRESSPEATRGSRRICCAR